MILAQKVVCKHLQTLKKVVVVNFVLSELQMSTFSKYVCSPKKSEPVSKPSISPTAIGAPSTEGSPPYVCNMFPFKTRAPSPNVVGEMP